MGSPPRLEPNDAQFGTAGFVIAYEHHRPAHPRIPRLVLSFWLRPPGTGLGKLEDAAVFSDEARRSLTLAVGAY